LNAAEVKYTVLTADAVKPSLERIKEAIIRELGSQIMIREINSSSPEGAALISQLNIKVVPYVIFDKSIIEHDKFFALAKSGMIDRIDGNYTIPDNMLRPFGVLFIKRAKLPNNLEVFIRSHDTASIDVQRQLGSLLGLHPESGVILKYRYLAAFRDFGIDSTHGPAEIKEDILQILVQKYYPDKLSSYLEQFRQRRKTADICNSLGINLAQLENRVEEGTVLLEQDSLAAEELGVTESPAFLWENQVLFFSIEQVKDFIKSFNAPETAGVPGKKQSGSGTSLKDSPAVPVSIMLFYQPTCTSCHEVINTYIPRLKDKYGNRVLIEMFDLSIKENYEKNLRFEEQYGVLGGGVPRVYAGEKALVGRKVIERDLEGIIDRLLSENIREKVVKAPAPVTIKKEPAQDSNGSLIMERFKSLAPMTVSFAGLLDGINPCAFSTVVFFISFLSFAGYRRKQMLWVGLSFTFAVFLTYLALGLGLFSGLQRLSGFTLFQNYFDKVVGIVALCLGLFSLYDYFCYKRTGKSEGMILQLPGLVKHKIHTTIRAVKDGNRGLFKIMATAFFVGVGVSVLESVCTGQLYVPAIAFVLKMKVMWARAALYLLLYNAFFILPLLLVLFLALAGFGSERWTKIVGSNLGRVKLATALFFTAMAVVIFYWK
jgi:hypothetical protein